jgi:hemolysin III
MHTQTEAAPPPKPLLRGALHEVAASLALSAWILLVVLFPAGEARLAAVVYGASLFSLFFVSALYHRPAWRVRARLVMRRLDHAAIFVLIAGTYTPMCLLLGRGRGSALLAVVWGGAALGVLQAVFWTRAPRALRAGVYVSFGWVVLPILPSLRAALGNGPLALLATGGVLYTVGAVIYATRRPNPSPKVFGYHEVFHALVVAAAGCHLAVVVATLRAIG